LILTVLDSSLSLAVVVALSLLDGQVSTALASASAALTAADLAATGLASATLATGGVTASSVTAGGSLVGGVTTGGVSAGGAGGSLAGGGLLGGGFLSGSLLGGVVVLALSVPLALGGLVGGGFLGGGLVGSGLLVDNQNIPYELVAKAAEIMKRPTRNEEAASAKSACSRDEDEDEEDNDVLAAIVLLQDFSFLRRRTSAERVEAYEMHKLVQEATQYSFGLEKRGNDQSHFSELALQAVISLFPERRRELWGECEKYLGHAQRAAEWAGLCHGEVEAAALLTLVSDYLYDRGRWKEKEPVDESAYEYRRKVLGEKHPDTIWSMADLATTYHQQGRYDNAAKIYVEVLALWRDVLGEKHPDTLQAMHDLAVTWNSRQRRPEALAMMQECFQLQCNVLGHTHPSAQSSLRAMSSLGGRTGKGIP